MQSCREVWSNMAEDFRVTWLLQDLQRLETEIVTFGGMLSKFLRLSA